jgi:hypothetical protein
MPLYRFGFDDRCLVEDAPEWHPNDVAAIKAAAQSTADLARTRSSREPISLVLAFRVKA